MRAEELPARGIAAVPERASTNGDLHPPPWAEESFWHESAPDSVRTAFAAGDQGTSWKAWKRHLLRRRRPTPLARLWHGKSSMLTWSADIAGSARLTRLIEQLGRRRKKQTSAHETLVALVEQWCDEQRVGGHPLGESRASQPAAPHDDDRHANGHASSQSAATLAPPLTAQPLPLTALENLAWLHLLVARPDLLSGELWWRAWAQLLELALRPASRLESDPLAHQLSAGELPLSMAALLPELNPCRAFHVPAAAALSHGMAELLDGEGLPQCRYLNIFHQLVACWARCRLLAPHLDGGCWNAAAEDQFPMALREFVRLSRRDGSPITLAARNAGRPGSWLADVGADLTRDKPTRRLIRARLGEQRNNQIPDTKPRQLPAFAVHSEWAEIGVLRTDWSPRGAQLTVAYGGQQVGLELAIGADSFFAGQWELEVRADGAVAEPDGEWREVCWESDEDCDYLEIELELSESICVQRQMLLSRKDQFLFLADAVMGERPGDLAYRGRLPLTGLLTASAAPDTREMLLEARKARALILPLALPEWRADSRGSSLGVAGRALELRQSCVGRRLFAPLWIDLSRRRSDQPFTWRQLTVAEQRQTVPRDVAAGYRIQFGRRQWLVYRSLAEPANRTLLGQNLSTDFFLGRFGRDGESETIIEIE